MRTHRSRWTILMMVVLALAAMGAARPVQAQDCPAGMGFECDINRGGSDYAASDLPQPDPRVCQQACQNDNNCRAWTYVRPGVQGQYARCYLKNPEPAASANNCCISGTASRIINQQYAFEVDTNRGGSDYERFEMQMAVPDQCFERCRGDSRCAAWTFVRPGVQGPLAVCYLKNPAPAPSPNNCCVSGVIPGGGVTPPVTPPPPPPPPQGPCDWNNSNRFFEEHSGGRANDWYGVFTRIGGNRFQAEYRHPNGDSRSLGVTLDIGPVPGEVHMKRDDYPEILVYIDGNNVGQGSYQGGTRFTLTCGGQ